MDLENLEFLEREGISENVDLLLREFVIFRFALGA